MFCSDEQIASNCEPIASGNTPTSFTPDTRLPNNEMRDTKCVIIASRVILSSGTGSAISVLNMSNIYV